jgi:photosystem II stability/assembly factor-like uncharacterized protein
VLDGIYAKAFALDANHVWVAKSFYPGRASEGSIWQSTDGGFNWSRLAAAPTSDTTTNVYYSDFRFTPSGIGVAIGTTLTGSDSVTSFASQTTDFGTTWMTVELPAKDPKTVLTTAGGMWFIFGGDPKPYMLRSSNAGRTWEYTLGIIQSTDYDQFQTAALIPPTSTLMVCSITGIYKSTDLGVTFTKITSPTDVQITDLSIDVHPDNTSGQLIIARSPVENFLRSEDGGKSWSTGTYASKGYHPFAEIRIAQGVIYAIPDQGELRKSTDKGYTWTSVYVPASSGRRALYAADKDNVVLQAYEGILYSSDGGASWTQTPFPGKYWLNESSIPVPGMVVSGGGYYDTNSIRGVIYRTTNVGYDWQIVDFPREINHLKMITSTTGFALSDYEVYKTIDGARTWTKILGSNDYFTHYVYCFFDDSLRGLLRVSFTFQQTMNGGSTWQLRDLGMPIYQLAGMAHEAHTRPVLCRIGGFIYAFGNQHSTQSFQSHYPHIIFAGVTFPYPVDCV